MNLSYHQDWKTGPTIVLVGTTLFVAALAATGTRGMRRAGSVDAHPA
jgi:ABC-type Mn2+/Zn2+ transport system permease subunit